MCQCPYILSYINYNRNYFYNESVYMYLNKT